jgi:hypothetical protein
MPQHKQPLNINNRNNNNNTMIKIENNNTINGKRARVFVLLSLFLMYHNHISVSAYGRFNRRSYNAYNVMKQTGIFPRGGGGGAVNRYTDVVQLSQRSPSATNGSATRTRRRVTKSSSHPFVSSHHSQLPDDGSIFQQDQEEDNRDQDYIEDGTNEQDQEGQTQSHVQSSHTHNNVWRNILPPAVTDTLDEMFAPGALLVTGKVIATAVIYLSISRASLFQIHNISDLRAFVMNPSNLRKLVTVPGMFLRNRLGNRNKRERSSVAGTDLSSSFRDEEFFDSSSDEPAIEEELEGEYDIVSPSTDESMKVVQVDDAFSSFVKPVDDLGREHFHKFLFHDVINA